MSTSVSIPVSQATGNFVRQLFSVFERTGIRYCVLHGWDELPDNVSSDLDLVLHPEDYSKLELAFSELSAHGYKWIQCRNYAGCSYRFDFAWFEGEKFHVIGVDCIFEYRYAGLILRSGAELLEGRRQHDGFWIASTETVFAYMLMKKTLKGVISSEQLSELKEVAAEIGTTRSLSVASDLFGTVQGAGVVSAIADESLPGMLPRLRSYLRRVVLGRNPWSFVRYHADEMLRLVKRWLQPTGLLLIALGPDGVGKSTVLADVVENLKPAFRGIYFFHYRATFSAKSNTPVTNPHARQPRGPILSILRVVVLFIQFWISYLLIVRPKLGRSGLVVFDRYFHDLLVDRLRYRYSGPQWLLRLMLKFIPGQDAVVLVMDADELVIHSRKQEVPIAYLRELRRGYQMLAAKTSHAALIRTDQDLHNTSSAATEAIYQHLLRRGSSRYPKWTKGYLSGDSPSATPSVSLERRAG